MKSIDQEKAQMYLKKKKNDITYIQNQNILCRSKNPIWIYHSSCYIYK